MTKKELKEEELEKISGGKDVIGNCGWSMPPKSCTKYDITGDKCNGCKCLPNNWVFLTGVSEPKE